MQCSRSLSRRSSREQIEVCRQHDYSIGALKQAAACTPAPDLLRTNGTAPFPKWRSKGGRMEISIVARVKDLEDENWRLKKMYADALPEAAG